MGTLPPYQGMFEDLLLAPESVGHRAAEPKRGSEENHARDPEFCKRSGGGVAGLEVTEPRGAILFPSPPAADSGCNCCKNAKGKSAHSATRLPALVRGWDASFEWRGGRKRKVAVAFRCEDRETQEGGCRFFARESRRAVFVPSISQLIVPSVSPFASMAVAPQQKERGKAERGAKAAAVLIDAPRGEFIRKGKGPELRFFS